MPVNRLKKRRRMLKLPLANYTKHTTWGKLCTNIIHYVFKPWKSVGITCPLWMDSTQKEPVMWSFGFLVIIRLNKLFNQQPSSWWFDSPWHPYDIIILTGIAPPAMHTGGFAGVCNISEWSISGNGICIELYWIASHSRYALSAITLRRRTFG